MVIVTMATYFFCNECLGTTRMSFGNSCLNLENVLRFLWVKYQIVI